MFNFIFYIAFTAFSVKCQPCDDVMSVDLTGGETFSDRTIVKDGVTFPPKYVYEKNVSGEIKTFGCPCEIKKCIRKCCGLNSVLNLGNKTCIEMPENDSIANGMLNLTYTYSYKRKLDVKSGEFNFVYGRPCVGMYIEAYKWYIQEDGSLYVEMPNSIPPWSIRGPDNYCIDTFVLDDGYGVKTTQLDALVCFAENQEDHHYVLSSTCMLISCVFILATCAVYAWLPELRNLHGRVLMAYLLCLFVGFSFLTAMQILLVIDNITALMCIIMTIIIYFSLLSAFFWLNVMCFDIWWTFSGKRGLSLEKLSTRGRFYAYALYAFSIPTALTILLTALEFSGLPPHPLLPLIRHQGCFIFGTSKLIYLYGPIVILCVANMIFFVLTALKITQIKQQTSVLKSKESSTHDLHRNDKQRLLLYVKLFAVMGINWILEVISAIYPQANSVWRITDAYNVLIGVIIFIIFVCKRKIFHLIKKRYKQLRGDPMSRNQTTVSSRTSSRDETRLNSIKMREK